MLAAFEDRCALKAIAGLMNFDRVAVADISRAAAQGGATHIDVAADAELVEMARQALGPAASRVAVCVSGVDPVSLAAAMAHADMGEVGNFDWFYATDEEFTIDSDTVLHIASEVRRLCPDKPLSVTVPHTLPLDAQVDLAQQLEQEGLADIIQTEGAAVASPAGAGVLGLIEKASPTLAATHAISRGVTIPVMAASGVTDVTAPLAIAAGASGVGIGTFIAKQNSEVSRIAAVRAVYEALGTGGRVKA